uniref:HAT C-terminal dimerisation domain-containing protein n=1 Tax=Labrus bergylta TaxID=56723 RepID=A0A3Q3NFP3_9LABR
MSFLTLKFKIENEKRRFNPAWTDKYLFILPPNASAKPMCLLCNECLAKTHRTFQIHFPEGSQERAAKVQSLIASYNRSCTTMVQSCTAQERATAASLRVSWILAKKKRPFTDSETVKDCMLAVVDEVINDVKIKTSVTSAIKNVPLSDTSNICRVEILATDVFETLLEELKKADVMSIAVDESTDRTDTAQLCIYVRFSDGKCFREELLGLLPLQGHTTGEIVFGKISAFLKNNGLDMERVCMLVTDGAPSMAGKVNGLALKTTMNSVMATINLIRSTSSLQHRLFCKLLSNMSTEHHDLLWHNDVRWLSKGKALERFCRDKTVTDLLEQMHAFQVKLDFFTTDLNTGRMLHFPTLCKRISSSAQITFVMTDFIVRLKENFAGRLDGLALPTEVMGFVRDPFTVATEGDLSTRAKEVVPSIDEGEFISCRHAFPNVKKVAIIVLSMFGSTYTCESSFSHMNSIKSSSRCSLTDNTLHQCLRIALTSYEPKVTALVQKEKFHFSH